MTKQCQRSRRQHSIHVCVRKKQKRDCQTSAHCSAAAEGWGGRGKQKPRGEKSECSKQKGQVPTPVLKTTVKAKNLKKQKRAEIKKDKEC